MVKAQEKKKRKDWSPNKKSHLKMKNAQWGALKVKNTSSIEQVMQKDGRKTWKDSKPRKTFSNRHNCSTQYISDLNFLESH